MHKVGKYFIESRDDWSTWWRYYNQEAEFFKCNRSVEDGEIITLGPHEFQVIYTPGHASDGIVLYNQREKILISADTLFGYLMDTYWFKETVDLYFKGRYEAKYDAVINSFLRRGIVKQENGDLHTTVKP